MGSITYLYNSLIVCINTFMGLSLCKFYFISHILAIFRHYTGTQLPYVYYVSLLLCTRHIIYHSFSALSPPINFMQGHTPASSWPPVYSCVNPFGHIIPLVTHGSTSVSSCVVFVHFGAFFRQFWAFAAPLCSHVSVAISGASYPLITAPLCSTCLSVPPHVGSCCAYFAIVVLHL